MSAANPVEVSLREGVATLTIHGAHAINIIGTREMNGLLQAGQRLRGEADLRLVILTGAPGQGFIGGADIGEMARLDPDSARDFITRLHHVCRMLRTLPVPSIARIEGYCLGAGMEVAAACDLRIGAAGSHYGMPEVQVGLPSVIEAVLLPTLIGWGHTRELLYTGRVIGAEEAQRMGFLQRVAPDGTLDDGLEPWRRDILAAEPGAIRTQKQLVELWLDAGAAHGIQASIEAFSATFQRPDAARRLQAFLNRKRRP